MNCSQEPGEKTLAGPVNGGSQDRLLQLLFPRISWLLPSRYHAIRVEDLGRAMRINAERPGTEGTEILHYADFVALLRSEPAL